MVFSFEIDSIIEKGNALRCDRRLKKKKKMSNSLSMSHERAWFSTEMDFKASLKCISSIYQFRAWFRHWRRIDRKLKWNFLEKIMLVSYLENHARKTNFLDKIITIRPLIIECAKRNLRHCYTYNAVLHKTSVW